MEILNSSVAPYANGSERQNEAHVPKPRTTDCGRAFWKVGN